MLLRLREGHGVLRRIGRGAHRRARPAGVERVDADPAGVLELVRERLGQPLGRELRYRVCPPIRPADPADTGRREHDGCIGGSLEQRQQGAREENRRHRVHLHHLRPRIRRVVGDGHAGAQHRSVVQDPVEAPVVVADGLGEVLGRCLVEPREVGRCDDGPRAGFRADGIEDRFQLGPRAPEEHHVRPVTRIGQGRDAADTVPGAGHQHDPVPEQVGRRAVTWRAAPRQGAGSLRAWTT